MPRYSIGTAPVILSSDTVIGSGIAFDTNARAGDAFRGLDGRWYEIGNVTSATMLTIRPAYQGATANRQAYSITPVQGYPKALVNQSRDLSSQWDPLLAAVKPWATASTGSQTQANMGTIKVDRAINGASAVGDTLGSLGGVSKTQAPMAPDMDVVNESGWFSITPDAHNIPLGNNNISGMNGRTALSMVLDANTRYRLLFVRNTSPLEAWYRSYTSGTWKEWVRFYTIDNIVGIVMRRLVTGKPTGAVMESRTTSNDWHVRSANGTQVAAARSEPGLPFGANVTQLPAASVTGFNTGVTCNWIPSSGQPATAGQGVHGAYLNGNGSVSSTTAQTLGVNDIVTMMAVGRWY